MNVTLNKRIERKFELSFYGGTVSRFITNKKIVALTFDDGPHPKWTPALIDILNKFDAKATFFVQGKYAKKYLNIIDYAYDSGHCIGNHSWDHPSFPEISNKEIVEQLDKCEAVIGRYNSFRLFRPPFGNLDKASRREILKNKYKIITWNIVMHDWHDQVNVCDMYQYIDKISPGSIILLHDTHYIDRQRDRSSILELVTKILTNFSDKFRFVSIPEMFQYASPKVTYWQYNHPLHNK